MTFLVFCGQPALLLASLRSGGSAYNSFSAKGNDSICCFRSVLLKIKKICLIVSNRICAHLVGKWLGNGRLARMFPRKERDYRNNALRYGGHPPKFLSVYDTCFSPTSDLCCSSVRLSDLTRTQGCLFPSFFLHAGCKC